MTPVILSRQQLDRLWEIDRSEIIDTLYKLDNGRLQAYPQYYDVRGWDPHDRRFIRLFTRPATIAAVYFSPFRAE